MFMCQNTGAFVWFKEGKTGGEIFQRSSANTAQHFEQGCMKIQIL